MVQRRTAIALKANERVEFALVVVAQRNARGNRCERSSTTEVPDPNDISPNFTRFDVVDRRCHGAERRAESDRLRRIATAENDAEGDDGRERFPEGKRATSATGAGKQRPNPKKASQH
jgi:hypothetical protein